LGGITLALPPAKVESPLTREGNTMPLALPAVMTLLAVLWYVITALHVARAHVKYTVPAPAMTGHPVLERSVRVQMNTLEQLAAFLPAMWIYAWYGNPRWAAIACAVWIVGRIVYAFGYWADADKRAPGFVISFVTLAAVWVAALISVVRVLDFA
jgi:glutathione S-transferase